MDELLKILDISVVAPCRRLTWTWHMNAVTAVSSQWVHLASIRSYICHYYTTVSLSLSLIYINLSDYLSLTTSLSIYLSLTVTLWLLLFKALRSSLFMMSPYILDLFCNCFWLYYCSWSMAPVLLIYVYGHYNITALCLLFDTQYFSSSRWNPDNLWFSLGLYQAHTDIFM